tara:strand:+ start:429 stop:1244 length:816 start_codon:yes stop_codon:yes gene_type:complete
MARSFILGGVSATGLATGKPYIKRIIRKDSTGAGYDAAGNVAGGGAFGALRGDGLTCKIVTAGASDGAISFSTTAVDANIQANDGRGKDWATDGELIFVEFPATTRTFSVQAEAFNQVGGGTFRAKVMLVAQDQKAFALDSVGAVTSQEVELAPYTNTAAGRLQGGNFIEIQFTGSEIATINARTKGVFILIEKFETDDIFNPNGTPQARGQGATGTHADDAVAILVTAILDHEGFDGSHGVQTDKIYPDGAIRPLKKIHPLSVNSTDGVG